MKSNIYLSILFLAISIAGCVKDPLDEIEEGGWNNERSIIDIAFENQVGKASITRDGDDSGTITISINVDAVPDLSNIVLKSIQTSFNATSSVQVNDALNFENEDQSSQITVTSPTGISRNYTVYVNSFQETIIGTYAITDLVVYGGTGPEYGGASVISMTSKPWIWPDNGGPSSEQDNTITFQLDGITEEGNTYGTIINNAGEDGLYADFVYIKDPVTDVNHFYRKIPEGEGTWTRNYSTGKVTFTFSDGTISSGTLIGAGTQDLGNGKSKTTENNALMFNLDGSDDWDNIYSDYDKFVKRPRIFWIDIERI